MEAALPPRPKGRGTRARNLMENKKWHDLALQLFDIGAIRFGSFTLKSGMQSPIYLDLRLTVSYPNILNAIADILYQSMQSSNFDLLCGVPYTALPFATVISVQQNVPMVMRRKEKKEYGMGKIIEGVYRTNQRCLIVEDIITSGSSISETADALRTVGLVVEDAVVLVDRMQGGVQSLQRRNIDVQSIFNLMQILQILRHANRIESCVFERIQVFLQENQTCLV